VKITELIAPAADWTGGSWANRLSQAASLLYVHGYITLNQRVGVTAKLERQFSHALETGAIIHVPDEL